MKTLTLLITTVVLCWVTTGCKQQVTNTTEAITESSDTLAPADEFSFYREFTYNAMSFEVQTKGSDAVKILRIMAHQKNNPVHLLENPIEGSVIDVFANDLNENGKPELYVQIDSPIKNNYTLLKIYEFSGPNHYELSIPKLNQVQSKGYKGNDKYQIENNQLIRTFPSFPTGSSDKAMAPTLTITYALDSNSMFHIIAETEN